MSDNESRATNAAPDGTSNGTPNANLNLSVCPHCGGALTGQNQIESIKVSARGESSSSPHSNQNSLATTASHTGEGLSKWEQDTFRDVLNNANNTLRFQVQLAVPLLAGCVTALNIIPPQAHQELLNLIDRWVFIPVLLSMGVAYFGLELHWTVSDGTILDNVQGLAKLVRKKYDIVHLAIILQAVGLILLMTFVLLEYK